jgi:predicted ATPase
LNLKLLNKLYGQTKPQTQLAEAFQQVCEPESNVEVVMIHGVPGVGKTALVQDWKKCVVSKTPSAYFLEAKYHQISSMSEPFAAFRVAFGS